MMKRRFGRLDAAASTVDVADYPRVWRDGSPPETMSETLCASCAHMREVISGTGSRFLLCRLSQTEQRFPKYPPQPVVRCGGWKARNREVDSLPNDAPLPTALCLDQFLKLASIVESGGQAKVMIQGGEVKVNGETETRRRRKLTPEDVIEAAGRNWLVKDFVSRLG